MGLHQRGRSRHRVMGAGTEGIPGRGDDMGKGLEVKEGTCLDNMMGPGHGRT